MGVTNRYSIRNIPDSNPISIIQKDTNKICKKTQKLKPAKRLVFLLR